MAVSRRILLLVTDLEIGGTPTVVRELALRLRDPQTHVEVACLSKWGPNAKTLTDAGVHVTAFDARGGRDLVRTVFCLRNLIRRRRIDTVVSFLVHANVIAALASVGRRNVRWFQSVQTVQPTPRWHWRAQRYAARHADKLFVPSTAIVRALDRRCDVPATRCVVIPNAVEPTNFVQRPTFNDELIRVGCIGRLDPVKRLDRLLVAAARMKSEIRLTFYGEGSARVALEAEVRRAGLEDTVHFAGVVAAPQAALGEIDVLWLGSAVEGFGMVLIEAMAAGVTVVALEAGGTTDVLVNERNALSFRNPNDTAFFAAATRRLRDDPALRAALIAGGLHTVAERFSWRTVLPLYRQLFDPD